MDERIVKYQEKMDKTLANLDSEFGTIRAGRANPHVLDRIMVEYYGAPTPLQQGCIATRKYYYIFSFIR